MFKTDIVSFTEKKNGTINGARILNGTTNTINDVEKKLKFRRDKNEYI